MKNVVKCFVLWCALMSPALADPTGLDLYVLPGQSNNSGRDTSFTIPTAIATDSAVLNSWVFNDTWHQGRLLADNPGGETRTVLIDPLASMGINLSLTLTIGRAAATGNPIGIVTCAKGGTSAKAWLTSATLFANCIQRIQAALPGNTLRGIVWYQGEADRSDTFTDFVRYYQRTIDTLNGFRTALSTPDVPIVLVGLGDFTQATGDPQRAWQTIQALQKQIAHEVPNCAFVSAAGLPLLDGLHLTGAANLTLGTMVADAFATFD